MVQEEVREGEGASGMGELEEPVWRFCLFILRSQWGSSLQPLARPPPLLGSDLRFIFIWAIIEVSFNVLT